MHRPVHLQRLSAPVRRVFSKALAGSCAWCVLGGAPALAQLDPFPFTRPVESPNPTPLGRFGAAIAHGDRVMVVGAPGDSVRGPEAGSVHVFERDALSGTYTLSEVLTPSQLLPFDRFGGSLGIFGNVLAVGATGDDSAAPNSGAVYIFTRAGSGQPFQLLAKLTAPLGRAGVSDEFGASISVLVNRVVVGAPRLDGPAFETGAAFVYDVDMALGQVLGPAVLEDPAGRAGDGLGRSVAMGLGQAYVGADRYDVPGGPFNAGAVLVFDEGAGGTWPLGQVIESSVPRQNGAFGRSISLEPPRSVFVGTLVVGEPRATPPGQFAERGVVHIYEAFLGNPWTHVLDHGRSDPRTDTLRGTQVAVQAGVALASAPGRNGQRGGVDLLRRDAGVWAFEREVALPEGALEDRAGLGLSYRNDIPVIGAPGRDGVSGLDEGVVWTTSALWAGLGEVSCTPSVLNSTETFASLAAKGSPAAADNNVVLEAGHMPPGFFVLPLVGTDSGFVPGAGGSNGTLCIGGAIGRFTNSLTMIDASGHVAIPIDLAMIPQPSGSVAVSAGETWYFQIWYRDVDPVPTSNYTSALALTFE